MGCKKVSTNILMMQNLNVFDQSATFKIFCCIIDAAFFFFFLRKNYRNKKEHFSINAYLYSCLIEFAMLPPLSFYVRSATINCSTFYVMKNKFNLRRINLILFGNLCMELKCFGPVPQNL